MQKWLLAILIGAAVVAGITTLNRLSIAVQPTAIALSPGLFAGAIAMGGIDPEANTPSTPFALAVLYAVNIALYSALAYVVLSVARYGKRQSISGV